MPMMGAPSLPAGASGPAAGVTSPAFPSPAAPVRAARLTDCTEPPGQRHEGAVIADVAGNGDVGQGTAVKVEIPERDAGQRLSPHPGPAGTGTADGHLGRGGPALGDDPCAVLSHLRDHGGERCHDTGAPAE